MIKNLIATLCGLVGIIIGLAVWHIYTDHILLHNIVNALTVNAQQMQKQQQDQSK